MKNISPFSLKKCIFMEATEYEQLIRKVLNMNIKLQVELDGIWYEDQDDKELDISNELVMNALSNYFDVNITSIHIDDCDIIGVWICYKEE